ncbi:hypothetical protein HK101_008361 [Irineochytrium annulatum]|nr:hypothetical protein HK101_008361 [Irineochytrium annulatum]
MLVVDDSKVLDEILIGVFRQLNADRPADRYALHNCLVVSRRYFQQAAERMWSAQIFPVSIHEAARYHDRFRFLFEHVLVNEPAIAGDHGRPACSRDWRITIYMGSLRKLLCLATGKSDCLSVPPERLLPWIKRLDWVDMQSADETWARALAKRFSVIGQHPHHLILGPGKASDVMSLACRTVPSLLLTIGRSGEDGGLAKYLRGLVIGNECKHLQALCVECWRGPNDLEAIAECIIANGKNLRALRLSGSGTPIRFSAMATAKAISSMACLEQLDVQIDLDESRDFVVPLLLRSASTLIALYLLAGQADAVNVLPMKELTHLRALKVSLILTSSGRVSASWLGSMTSLVSLSIASYMKELDGVSELLEHVNKMTGLRELAISLSNCKPKHNEQPVQVQMRWSVLRRLRLIRIVLASSSFGVSCFGTMDRESKETDDFPHLEELYLDFDLSCISGSEDRMLSRVMINAVLDEGKTPALANARIINRGGPPLTDPAKDSGPLGGWNFKLVGGRSKFSSLELGRLREHFKYL